MTHQAPSGSDLPAFDRRFFDGAAPCTQIGSGEVGGKAAGLVFVRDVLTGVADPAGASGIEVNVPRMAVIATGVFAEFMRCNKLDELPLADLPDDRIAHAFQRTELPTEVVGDLRALIAKVHTPLAVRSSSLLEDALHRPFAGVYATKMIPNNQADPDARFRRLVEAIKFVYASTYFKAARDYIRATDRRPEDERMAVIIQEVVGRRHGDRFYPDLSGVARSFNFYPTGPARPDEGVVSLALGLGKTIVDGGVAWTYSPAHPRRSPPFGSINQCLKETQIEFWSVNMGKPPAYDPVNETEYLVRADLGAAEIDGVLRYTASTYDPASDRLLPGVGAAGPRVLTFAPLLVLGEFPINALIRQLLAAMEQATQAKVEIEFAMTFDAPRDAPARARLGFLQVRPMVVADELVEVSAADLADPRALAASSAALGNGVAAEIRDIVLVRPDRFAARDTPVIAAELETFNRELQAADRPYLLIGFGRWGSSDPWLGIPVKWGQIAGARAIVEATLPDLDVEPSQGSHFFHNLSSFRVSYFTVHHAGPFAIDWDWLHRQELVRETDHVRQVRLNQPLTVRVDGRTARGVILREA